MKNNRYYNAIPAITLLAFLLVQGPSKAAEAPTGTLEGPSQHAIVNLSFPEQGRALEVPIDAARSKAYGWKPGQTLHVTASIEGENSRETVRDREGQTQWEVLLDEEAQGVLRVSFDEKVVSGPLKLEMNGKPFYEPEMPGRTTELWIEKVHEYRFDDGVRLKVHFTDRSLEMSSADPDLGSQVMDAAVMAYQTITSFEGFNSPGYSFAHPDMNYAYDPDRTIDIYLGSPSGENQFAELGVRNRMFKDAPCFDTIQAGPGQYHAVILLPANYREFIKNWEKINPSPMGKRNLHVDLRGTLIHEMLHVVVFYYNKNLNKTQESEPDASKDLDWYVEGLARYFETFAGARHDFYSQGFKQRLPDKVRFSRGGSNYFMRYPDQPFTRLRYENALFWRYMDYRYGMSSIEALSRGLRGDRGDIQTALESVTGQTFEALLLDFARAVLEKDFGLKEDSAYLNNIAKTHLRYKEHAFYLVDGWDNEQRLGAESRTDWIGEWEDSRAAIGEPSIAGDSTSSADVSAWATDFIRIDLDRNEVRLPVFQVVHEGAGSALSVQLFCLTKGGTELFMNSVSVGRNSARKIDVVRFVRENGLGAEDIDHLELMITNTDPNESAGYSLKLA